MNTTADQNADDQTPPMRPPKQPIPQNNGEPSMYGTSDSVNCEQKRVPQNSWKLPSVSESSNPEVTFQSTSKHDASGARQYFTYDGVRPVTPTSGFISDPRSLNAFEGLQRNLVDQLLSNKRSGRSGTKSNPGSAEAPRFQNVYQDQTKDPHYPQNADWTQYRENSDPGSPSKKSRPLHTPRSFHTSAFNNSRFWDDPEPKTKANHHDQSSRFSFSVNDDTFNRTRHQSNGFSNSAENISTKFTPEDWDGKFEAGGEYFKPEGKSRAQSTSRSRGRSPVRIRPVPPFQPTVETETPIESPGAAKFSAEEWNETFKPQTFMPPPSVPTGRATPGRKRTGPILRPTMGGNAAVVDDGETSDEKPLFTGRKNASPMTGSPEPMDVDTPPVSHTVPEFAAPSNGHLRVNTESSKRAASASQSPTDTEGLKVNFDDLKIRDLISTLAMPTPPAAPIIPSTDRPSPAVYDLYCTSYQRYMKEWDTFSSKFLLHMVARKNQNDTLREKRWTDDRSTEYYRLGLKEDQAVLKRWGECLEGHEGVVRQWVIVRERVRVREERDGENGGGVGVSGERVRQRKKTH